MQHFKRLLYLWLKKVVGWAQVDVRGNGVWGTVGDWDNPVVATRTDGVTDATNPRRFTAAGMTAVSDGVEPGDYLLVFPTAAPATAGGFGDATRNGFYQVATVVSETEVWVNAWHGVHTDGLPLGESGLTFEVHRFRTSALMPIDDDAWVLEGTGVGGTFHLKCVNDRSINYGGGHQFEVSPWPDWLPGTHLWSAAPPRHTTAPSVGWSHLADRSIVFAYADLTQVFVVFRSYGSNGVANDFGGLYAGDVDPFHPASDPRPVVLGVWKDASIGDVFTRWQSTYGVQQIAADDSTYKQARLSNLVVKRGDASELLNDPFRNRSWFSGRWIRLPVLMTEEEVGFVELRGQLKGIWRTHEYGPADFTPVGANLEWLRIANLLMPWNGSKQLRTVY